MTDISFEYTFFIHLHQTAKPSHSHKLINKEYNDITVHLVDTCASCWPLIVPFTQCLESFLIFITFNIFHIILIENTKCIYGEILQDVDRFSVKIN